MWFELRVPGGTPGYPRDIVGRGRQTIVLDLNKRESVDAILDLLEHADVLIEGFRPGVMKRMGLAPEVLHKRNPQLIDGSITGWGQSGPLAHAAGHNIKYISILGALAAIGQADGPPVVPMNLVGDYGSGSLYSVMGILAALVETKASGIGQVVDPASCDGVVSFISKNHAHTLKGLHNVQRGSNMLDGGAP
jgi:alpha-methylacyl-CoA racemase